MAGTPGILARPNYPAVAPTPHSSCVEIEPTCPMHMLLLLTLSQHIPVIALFNLVVKLHIVLILCSVQGECFLPGTARPGLEVVRPHIQQPLITFHLNNSATTSIVYTTLDGALYLYAATTNGSLLQVSLAKWIFSVMIKHHCYISLQFYIVNFTASDFVRAIPLPLISQESIIRMVASNNGEYIFAMTPFRVRSLHELKSDTQHY